MQRLQSDQASRGDEGHLLKEPQTQAAAGITVLSLINCPAMGKEAVLWRVLQELTYQTINGAK
jgi:hypothetical protein